MQAFYTQRFIVQYDYLIYCHTYLYEYCLQVPSEVESKANNILGQPKEISLPSVYHTVLDKRLVVDGVHRSIGVQLKISKGEDLPEARLIECYGTNVVEMFESYFMHLIK
jgi:hypothetical protein